MSKARVPTTTKRYVHLGGIADTTHCFPYRFLRANTSHQVKHASLFHPPALSHSHSLAPPQSRFLLFPQYLIYLLIHNLHLRVNLIIASIASTIRTSIAPSQRNLKLHHWLD